MFTINYNDQRDIYSNVSAAESLLDLATFVLDDRKELALPGATIQGRQLAEIRLALEFRKRRPGLVFKAICEGWTRERIVKEMY